MKRFVTMAFAAALAVCNLGFGVARAETVVSIYPALPGPVENCGWFNDHLDDRSEGSLVRQIDLIYNRAALQPGAQVQATGTASTALGEALLGFTLNGRSLCAATGAFQPSN